MGFDRNDKASIIRYAKALEGLTLRMACGNVELFQVGGKGNFGTLLEKYYFEYQPNSDSQPDFVEVGMELKASPLKRHPKDGLVSKERIVLNMINYMQVVHETFATSSFWKKNQSLLLVFYLHELGIDVIDLQVKVVGNWGYPEADLQIIRADWFIIVDKVRQGKAHELSEGDTYYLGACTKGAKGGNRREQPFNVVKAKQRAFSLKQGYVNHILHRLTDNRLENYGRIMKSKEVTASMTLEDVVIARFRPFYGLDIDEIVSRTAVSINQRAKGFYASLTKAILGISPEDRIEEFEKADVVIRTVRLKRNGNAAEDISFPAFDYKELVQQSWDGSDLKTALDRKFFFVFYQYDANHRLILQKVMFWNMPYRDLREARKVWIETVRRILRGEAGALPKKSENPVCHVRPHARDASDTCETPDGQFVVKKSFWLNNSYIKSIYNRHL
jgi:DNA mismatch repair protein MutH